MRDLDEATALAFRLQNQIDACDGEMLSGLFRPSEYEKAISEIDAYCATLKGELYVPKWLVHSLLRASQGAYGNAFNFGERADEVRAMGSRLAELLKVLLTDRTLADLQSQMPRN